MGFYGLYKNIIEPAVIITTFTVGTVTNRRSRRRTRATAGYWAPPRHNASPLDDTPTTPSKLCGPDTSCFRNNLISRFLRCFPFLMEIWYWILTYWIYQLARAYSAYLIRGKKHIFNEAERHALSVLSLEENLGIAIEQHFQQYILYHCPWLIQVLRWVYYSHISVGIMFLVYCYTYMPLAIFQKIRRTIAMDNATAFVIITAYRCMPPRMLFKKGFVDVLHGNNTGNAWQSNRFQLTIAAMPSLHFGTALFIGVCLWRFAPHAWLRNASLLWPALMLITIVATANHFLLDAFVGALVPLFGWRLNEVLLNLRPLEEWSFWLCRTEKPREEDDGSAPASPLLGKSEAQLV